MGGGALVRAGGHRPHLDLRPRLRPQLHGILRHDHRQDEEGLLQSGMIHVSVTLVILTKFSCFRVSLGRCNVFFTSQINFITHCTAQCHSSQYLLK